MEVYSNVMHVCTSTPIFQVAVRKKLKKKNFTDGWFNLNGDS